MGVCVSFFCWGKTGSDREHFQFLDSFGEVKTLGCAEGWVPSSDLD